MKDKIAKVFGNNKLEQYGNVKYPEIHIIDLTRRTNSKTGMEIYDTQPDEIDTLKIENPGLDISATFFKPQCFLNERKAEPDNCEGVLYPSNYNENTWILFLEIKDCKATNISEYFTKTKKQVVSVVQIFRDKKIISQDKMVYANISFPRKNKTAFYHQLIKAGEAKRDFRDKHKIIIRGTNHLKIKNDTKIF